MADKKELLSQTIEHIDITKHNVVPLVEAMQHMAFSARDLARAADIYDRMLRDKECGVILCLAGSLVSAGLKQVFVDMVRNRMVDAIVSTGANIVDQDFFEGLGFQHYIADERLKAGLDDDKLRELHIDRIYDTLIDEDELRICDDTTEDDRRQPAAAAAIPRASSSARWATIWPSTARRRDSIVLAAYEERRADLLPGVFRLLGRLRPGGPSARPRRSARRCRIDSVKDFYELTQLKIDNPTTGMFMIGGGVPKNFTQDIVVAADILGDDAADAQIRHSGHRRRRPRRRPVELDARRKPRAGARSTRSTSRWSSAKPRSPCR